MMNTVRFSCTALVGKNKVGTLLKDDNGYYKVVLGGLNVFNSSGAYYPFEPIKSWFEENSTFMRRVKNGALKAEYGHPKFKPGMTNDEYSMRILSIYEENICCHIKSIELDFTSNKDELGRPVVTIFGWIKPSGPMGYVLEQSLNNPDENVSFSIRSFTLDERIRGVINKTIQTIVTWDYVNEPGISIASKFNNPTLESLDERTFTRNDIVKAAKNIKSQHVSGVSMEATTISFEELMHTLGWEFDKSKAPAYTKW